MGDAAYKQSHQERGLCVDCNEYALPYKIRCKKCNDNHNATVRDFVSCNITLQKGLTGAKPPEFCYWLFDFMNLNKDDDFHDLFPGTGIVSACWEQWKHNQIFINADQGRLFL